MGEQVLNQDATKGSFVCCEKCGKKLIRRLPNGLWEFVFGKQMRGSNRRAPVRMKIYGSIKMDCLNCECDHESILNFFPDGITVEHKNDKPSS